MSELLTVPKACEAIGVSRSSFYRLRDRADFPKPFKTGMLVRWYRDELLSWLEGTRTK